MRTVEQPETPLDPLDGFLIAGAWEPSVPSRPTGLEEFLAQPPIPDEPGAAAGDGDASEFGAASSIVASDETTSKDMKAQAIQDDIRDAVSAIIAEGPRFGTAIDSPPPAPRAITAAAAALVAVEPRALIAASDALPVEPVDRTRETGDREDDRGDGFLGSFLEEVGLADPSAWFSTGSAANPVRQSSEAAPGPGFRPSAAGARSSSPGFGRTSSVHELELDSASASWGDRFDDSSPDGFEEIEARLSRVAARLEGAIDRIESTASSPLSARVDGFRGRVDE